MDRADIARLNSYQDTLARQAGADIQKLIEKLVEAVDSVDQLRDALLEAYPVFLADRGEQVAAASAEWYDKLRQAEIGGGTFATLPPSIPQEQAVATVRSAIALAYQGQAAQFVATLVDRTIFAVKRQGPATIAHNALRDPAAKRFARVPRGKTCAWCSVLASRGWVYTTAKAAGELGQYHSHCDCQIVPSFGRNPPKIAGYDPDALYKDYMAARESVIVRGDDLTANNIAAEMRRLPGSKFNDSIRPAVSPEGAVSLRRHGVDRWEIRPSGVYVPFGATLQEHELATADRLAEEGMQVFMLPIDNTPGVKNPDAEVDGVVWEFKAPRGSSPSTIQSQFKRAGKQAERLVLDLRRCGLEDSKALADIERRFYGRKTLREVIVIDHDANLYRHRLP